MMRNVEMGGSSLSRRVSEVIGVALFAVALIWLVSLVTYEPTDPVWFFTTGDGHTPANFVGRVGAFLAELSFQLFGYSAYVMPAVIGVAGWHYFWCQALDAAYTKLVGIVLLLTCSSAFLSLAFGTADVSGQTFRAGGYLGTWVGSQMAEYFNQTGSVILIVTMMMLSVMLSTQVSFGRLFAGASQSSRDLSARGLGRFRIWLDERRKEKQRRDVIARQAQKAGAGKEARPAADAPDAAPRTVRPRGGDAPQADLAAAGRARSSRRRTAAAPHRGQACPSAQRHVHASTRFAARSAQGRTQDR
jgi:hypothetical protein